MLEVEVQDGACLLTYSFGASLEIELSNKGLCCCRTLNTEVVNLISDAEAVSLVIEITLLTVYQTEGTST